MPQHDLEACLIDVEQAIEAALGHPVEPSVLLALRLEQVGAHHRRERPRDHQRENERHAHRHRELAEQQSDIAAHQEQRNEHGDERERDRHDGEADLAGPLHRRVVRREALLHMPHDVLDLDDGVVDHETDRDRQGHQREVVETVAHFVEHREGADQRQRHGDGRDNGRPETTQEYEDHHDDERNRQQQRELHVGDRCADGLGAIGNDVYLDGGRDRGLEHRHHRLDPTDGLDDVGAGLALDRQNDRPLLVEPGGNQLVLSRADGVADIADADRRPVAIGDDQVVVFVGLEQLIVGIERVGLARAVERAFRKVDIGLAEHRAHILEIDAARRQRLRIDLHADGRLLLTSDADEADSGYLRDLLQQDILRIGVDDGQRQAVRGDPEHQDRRVGRIDLADERRIRQVLRQVGGRSVDRRQRVADRPVDRAAQLELQGDLDVAERARRRHLGEAGDLTELQLERRCHRGCHGLRVGARQLRRDRKRRIVDVRKRRHRQ